jgi:hypothetical protein
VMRRRVAGEEGVFWAEARRWRCSEVVEELRDVLFWETRC